MASNIFAIENCNDFSERLNLDELYEKKQQDDLKKLEIYQKVLNRVHVRIRTVSDKTDDKCCWFLIPEIILGVPKYKNSECIAYVLSKLEENGFQVKYFHPNTLFISWNHFVPRYVRAEIKKKMGIEIDEYGNILSREDGGGKGEREREREREREGVKEKKEKKYTPIQSYQPSGKLIYNKDLLASIETKLNR
jgi:hypothetical protein